MARGVRPRECEKKNRTPTNEKEQLGRTRVETMAKEKGRGKDKEEGEGDNQMGRRGWRKKGEDDERMGGGRHINTG